MDDRKKTAACWWSLAIHLKIFPAIVFLFLFFRKDVKGIVYLLLAIVGCFVLALPFTGIGIWEHYVTAVLPRLSVGEINDTYAVSYQSFQVLMKNLFVPDRMHNPDAAWDNPLLHLISTRLYTVAILFCTALALLKTKDHREQFAWCILSGMLISGYGTLYGLLQLVVPMLLFFTLPKLSVRIKVLFFLILALAVNVPFSWFASLPLPFHYPRLWLLLLLFVLMLRETGMAFKPAYLLVFVIMLYPYHQKAKPSYVLQKEEALLIYDFEFSKGELIYSYFGINGPGRKTESLSMEVKSPVYYATGNIPDAIRRHPGERILKAAMVPGFGYVYLSDYGRGVGFYTLLTQGLNN